MSEPHGYSAGGFIPGPPIEIALAPDECVISFDAYECVRAGHQHDPSEAEQRRARVAMALQFFRSQHEGDAQRE